MKSAGPAHWMRWDCRSLHFPSTLAKHYFGTFNTIAIADTANKTIQVLLSLTNVHRTENASPSTILNTEQQMQSIPGALQLGFPTTRGITFGQPVSPSFQQIWLTSGPPSTPRPISPVCFLSPRRGPLVGRHASPPSPTDSRRRCLCRRCNAQASAEWGHFIRSAWKSTFTLFGTPVFTFSSTHSLSRLPRELDSLLFDIFNRNWSGTNDRYSANTVDAPEGHLHYYGPPMFPSNYHGVSWTFYRLVLLAPRGLKGKSSPSCGDKRSRVHPPCY